MMAVATTATSSALATAVLLCAAAFLSADGGHPAGTPKGGDLVATVCANATSKYNGGRRPLPKGSNYSNRLFSKEYCESALRSDKRSAAAKHPRDLAVVAIDLVQRGAADADAKVDAALREQGKAMNEAVLSLRYCRVDYDAMARTAPDCRAMVQEYKPGDGGGGDDLYPYYYFECADRLGNAAADCREHIFYEDGEVKKVVWVDVDEVVTRAALAKAMLQLMLGIFDTI